MPAAPAIRAFMRSIMATIALSAVAVMLYSSPQLQEWLQYDRSAIADGQAWRLLTCHLTHWSPGHLGWDVAMFLVLGALCERANRRVFLVCLTASAIAIPLAIAWLHPSLMFYRGLSGLDAAIFAMLAVVLAARCLRAADRRGLICTSLCLLALAAKIVYEMATGTAVFVHDATGILPLPLAHVVGGLTGILAGTACAAKSQMPVLRNHNRAGVIGSTEFVLD